MNTKGIMVALMTIVFSTAAATMTDAQNVRRNTQRTDNSSTSSTTNSHERPSQDPAQKATVNQNNAPSHTNNATKPDHYKPDPAPAPHHVDVHVHVDPAPAPYVNPHHHSYYDYNNVPYVYEVGCRTSHKWPYGSTFMHTHKIHHMCADYRPVRGEIVDAIPVGSVSVIIRSVRCYKALGFIFSPIYINGETFYVVD